MKHDLKQLISDRIKHVPESFIRKILKVSIQEDIISFAGGHPNADLFPVKEIAAASNKVLQESGRQALQYASTEGDRRLREWIAKRYQDKQGLNIPLNNILITSGSQQALDLLGKVLLNEDDAIAIENPGYLGAIQAFSVYQPSMHGIPLNQDGMDIDTLATVLNEQKPKLVYTVPNFQNPTGITYSEENRKAIAALISKTNSLLIQDDPYGELRFTGEAKTSFYQLLPEQTLLMGSFSKIIVPSLRIGWIVVPDELIKPMVIAKQAADLHTNYFSQQIIAQYLADNSLDKHIEKIRRFYARQKDDMLEAIKKYFPADVEVIKPEGGMFLWAILPDGISSMALFNEAIKQKVAFVPGEPFAIPGDEKSQTSTMRLSFVTVNQAEIEAGIKRLGMCMKKMS